MPEQDFKRNIAYKMRIGGIISGKPVLNGEKFSFLELGDRKVIRVNVAGIIVDKYESNGEKKYLFLTIDDGSGQIKLKAFGDDSEKFSGISHGQTVIVIGLLRYFNNEIYISPEIIKEQNPQYLVLRKIETEKHEGKKISALKTESLPTREKIADIIKNSEATGGINFEKISYNLKEISPETINEELQKLLEEGVIFEPRPGVVRWLG
ncbi:MAG: OB-fold nucleic acid binding domain-containing protein [Nanoarchaeota archaeon]